MIAPVQCKIARAGLDWGLRELAKYSGVGVATINRFEKGERNLNFDAMSAVVRTFEDAGVVFIPDTGDGIGVLVPETQAK